AVPRRHGAARRCRPAGRRRPGRVRAGGCLGQQRRCRHSHGQDGRPLPAREARSAAGGGSAGHHSRVMDGGGTDATPAGGRGDPQYGLGSRGRGRGEERIRPALQCREGRRVQFQPGAGARGGAARAGQRAGPRLDRDRVRGRARRRDQGAHRRADPARPLGDARGRGAGGGVPGVRRRGVRDGPNVDDQRRGRDVTPREEPMATKEATYTDAQVEEKLKELPGWWLEDGWIRRTYKTDGWPTTLMLVNAIAYLAEAAYHHPDLAVTWGRVIVKLKNHAAGGITDKDFELARKIDEWVLWCPQGGALEGTPNKFVRSGEPRGRSARRSNGARRGGSCSSRAGSPSRRCAAPWPRWRRRSPGT